MVLYHLTWYWLLIQVSSVTMSLIYFCQRQHWVWLAIVHYVCCCRRVDISCLWQAHVFVSFALNVHYWICMCAFLYMHICHSTLCNQHVAMGTVTRVRPCDFSLHLKKKDPVLWVSGLLFLNGKGVGSFKNAVSSHVSLSGFSRNVFRKLCWQNKFCTYFITYSTSISLNGMTYTALTLKHNYPKQYLEWIGLSWLTCYIQFSASVWEYLAFAFPKYLRKRNTHLWIHDYFCKKLNVTRASIQ